MRRIAEPWRRSTEIDQPDVTEAGRALLDDRLADLHDDPAAGRPWDVVEAELRSRATGSG